MSKIIKADQVRENPYLVKDLSLDTALLSLPDQDCHSFKARDLKHALPGKLGYSSMEELEESVLRQQAKLKEDMLQAEAMLSEAEKKSREIYEKAYAEGFQNGQSASEAKALEEAEALLDYLKDLGQAIALSQERIITSAEESIGKLALAIAGKILRREIQADESAVERIVYESLKAVKGGNSVKLKVNARDIDRIRDHKGLLLQALDNISNFEILEDPRVDQGGCIVETGFGTVDARIDSQLKEIGRAFFGDTGIQ